MTNNISDLEKIKELIDKNQNILLLTRKSPSFDSVGSMLSLYLGLSAFNKNVSMAMPQEVTVEYSDFISVNKIQSQISQKNFVISLDYAEGSIDKVSYNIEGKKFNLIIEPKPGIKPFTRDNVHFSNQGPQPELIIVINTQNYGQLENLYKEEKDIYSLAKVINIDSESANQMFGDVNYVDLKISCTCELIYRLIDKLSIKMTKDMATNILNTLYLATDNFRSRRINSKTFELAAFCTACGAVRFDQVRTNENTVPDLHEKSDTDIKKKDVSQKRKYFQEKRLEQPRGKNSNRVDQSEEIKTAPEEWLRPKIYKSNNQ